MDRIEEVKSHVDCYNLKLKKKGDGYKGCCPSHDDKSPSLTIRPGEKRVVFHCFAGCSEDQVISDLGLKKEWLFYDNEFGCEPKKKRGRPKKNKDLLEDFSKKKKIPVDYLVSMGVCNFKYENRKNGKNFSCIRFDYGNQFRGRIRNKKTFWDSSTQEEEQKLMRCYKPKEYQGDTLFIVEGESDTLTLCLYGYNALGVPGASNYEKIHHSDILGINKIFVVAENDKAGQLFPENVARALARVKFSGTTSVIDMSKTKYKDVNELHCDSGASFKNFISLEVEHSEAIHADSYECEEVGDCKKFQIYKDRIVYVENKRLYGKEIQENKTIIKQRVTVEKVHRDIFDNECNVILRWDGNKTKSFRADILLMGRNHGELAKNGIFVDSNNQNNMASYFRECISNVQTEECSKKNGWNGEEFVYGETVISKDSIRKIEFSSVGYTPKKKGTRKVQLQAINRLIDDQQIALKAGAAVMSPLLEKIGCENFTYHSWGDSSRGKTTGSKIGASFYCRPMSLLESWKSSMAGLETVMEEAGGLPIFLEESHKGKPERVVDIVYSFANKKQPAKSQMNNKLQRTRRKSPEMLGVIISTGESEISSLTADGGATARLLEQHKKKVLRKDYAETIEKCMADLDQNHGHIGEEIIQYFLNNRDVVQKNFDNYKEKMRESCFEGLQYRQVPYFAACMAGCEILRNLGINVPSHELLFKCCLETTSKKPKSLFEKSFEHVLSCVDVNRNNFLIYKRYSKYAGDEFEEAEGYFDQHIKNQIYGIIDEVNNEIHIFPKIFKMFLKEENINDESAKKAFQEKNILKHGKVGLTNTKRVYGKKKRVVTFCIPDDYYKDDPQREQGANQKPKSPVVDPVEEPVEKGKTNEGIHLGDYYCQGYELIPVMKFDTKRGLQKFDMKYKGEYMGTEWAKDVPSAKKAAVKNFDNHRRELIERNNSIEVWKKNNESVVTKEMIEDARTTEHNLFDGEYSQYDDDRGQ